MGETTRFRGDSLSTFRQTRPDFFCSKGPAPSPLRKHQATHIDAHESSYQDSGGYDIGVEAVVLPMVPTGGIKDRVVQDVALGSAVGTTNTPPGQIPRR